MRKAVLAGVAVVVCYAIYALAQRQRNSIRTTFAKMGIQNRNAGTDGNGKLDDLGNEGWELVTVTPAVYTPNQAPRLYSDSHAYFERPARILSERSGCSLKAFAVLMPLNPTPNTSGRCVRAERG